MAKKWIELHSSLEGVSKNGEPAYLKTSKSIDLGGGDVRIHETAAGGGAVLVSGDHQIAGYSTSDVQLKIFHPEGNPEYLSAPLSTPIDLKSVTKLDLRVFVPVGNPACSKITYRGHVSAQCVYEALESVSASPMFQGLGSWQVSGISADGTVLVGSRQEGTDWQAVRWTSETGLVGLGHLPGYKNSRAAAASQDGAVIVGYVDSGTANRRAFRWTQSSGLELLGTLPGDNTSRAYDVSADGTLVVGSSGNRAMVWTAGEGIQALPGAGTTSTAHGVSGDGAVIVGATNSDDFIGLRAFRWTAACGLVNITPDEDMGSEAFGVSADGCTAFGIYANHDDAFIWTPFSGTFHPETIEHDISNSGVYDASADGAVVIGFGDDILLWDKARCGAAYLKNVLTDELGLDLTGWQLDSAVAISDDGLTIVGNGNGPGNQTAWIARLG